MSPSRLLLPVLGLIFSAALAACGQAPSASTPPAAQPTAPAPQHGTFGGGRVVRPAAAPASSAAPAR